MKTFLFVLVAALAAAQQFQQRNDFTPAVRLAGTGFFQGSGTFTSSSSGDTSNQFQSRTDSLSGSSLDNRGFQSNSFQEGRVFQTGRDFQRASLQIGNDFQSGSDSQRSSFQGGNDFQSGSGLQRTSFQSGSDSRSNTFRGNDNFQTSPFQDDRDLQLNSFQRGIGAERSSGFQSGSAFLNNNDFQSGNTFLTNQGATAQSGSSVGSTFQLGNSQVNQNGFQSGSFQQQNQDNFQQKNQNSFQSGAFQQSSTSGSQSQRFSQGSQFQDNSQQIGSVLSTSENNINGVFEPLNLPSGASALLGSISTSFTCVDRPYGYYADQDNFCRVFHVCNPALFSDGAVQTYQYSFMCGEGTVFDQKELTCVVESAATPCQEASNYYIRNQEFGLPQEKFF